MPVNMSRFLRGLDANRKELKVQEAKNDPTHFGCASLPCPFAALPG